jgi:Ca2+-binding EF-hand superfamily protein
MTNSDMLYQMGFDFYDSNNDEQISEMDLFKVFQLFGNLDSQEELFEPFI